MGVLFIASPDLRTTWQFDIVSGNATMTSATKRTGSYSLYLNGNNVYVAKNIPGTTEGYIKAAVYCNSYNTRLDFYGGGQYHLTLLFWGTGVNLYRGTTTGTFLSNAGFSSGWHLFEFHWLIDDSVGVAQLKIDGSMEIDYSGDTKYGGTAAEVSYIRFYNTGLTASSYWDDIVVRDDDWPGRGGVYVLVPDSGSAVENWVASAGNPEDCVDELPVSTSDYVSTPHSPSGVEHLFNIESLPYNGAVNAIGIISYAKMEAAADGWCRNIIRSDSIMGSGEYISVEPTGRWAIDYFDTDPATSGDWTVDAVNSLEIGVEN